MSTYAWRITPPRVVDLDVNDQIAIPRSLPAYHGSPSTTIHISQYKEGTEWRPTKRKKRKDWVQPLMEKLETPHKEKQQDNRLVHRVASAIKEEHKICPEFNYEAQAAIREVAKWLKEQAVSHHKYHQPDSEMHLAVAWLLGQVEASM